MRSTDYPRSASPDVARGLRAALLLLTISTMVGGCSISSAPPDSTEPVALPTTPVVRTAVSREQSWDGVVEATHRATMSAQTSGRVLELPYDVNDYVETGAVIVRFSNVEQQAGQHRSQAQVTSAQAALDEAQANYARIADIYGRKLVAKAQFDQAQAQRDAARAALQSAQASLREVSQQLDYTVVRAPYSGIVTKRLVQVGESVQAGQALIEGVSLNELRVSVQVPQSAIDAIRAHHTAAVLIDGDKARVPAAKVTVFPYADPLTHTFAVRLDLPPQETGLYPGMTVKTAFAVGDAQRLLIPESAVVQRSEVTATYVVAGNEVNLRQLRLGHRFGDRFEVLSGLSEGEKVVTDPNAAALYLNRLRAGKKG